MESVSAHCVTLPLAGSDSDLDPTNEGGLYVSIGPSSSSSPGREGGSEEKSSDAERSDPAETTTAIRDSAVHGELGELALLDDSDRVRVYGEPRGRFWVFRLRSGREKENLKQRDQHISSWLHSLRAKIVRPEDCAQAAMGPSLDGSAVYAVVGLHRATSLGSLRRTLRSATGAGYDGDGSTLEVRRETARGLRAAAAAIERSTQSSFLLGLDAPASGDRRKQKQDEFAGLEVGEGGLAETAVLSSDLQYRATRVAWRPTGGRCVAVACHRGVCLWRMKARSGGRGASQVLGHLDSPTEMVFLQCRGAVRSMSWSPCGRLLACSLEGPSRPLLIWDVSLCVHTKLSPGLAKGSAHFLEFSPCGNYLLVATESGSFFVWETHGWTFQQWQFRSRMTDAVWITDHDVVLASFEGLPHLQQIRLTRGAPSLSIHLMQLSLPGVVPAGAQGADPVASLCWDPAKDNLVVTCGAGEWRGTTKVLPSNAITGSEGLFGRSLSSPGLLSWNAKDAKLAVSVRAEGSDTPTVAIYTVKLVPVVSAQLQALVELG